MNHNDFFEAAKTGRIQNLYLFEGTEEYIKGQALVRLSGLLLPAGLEIERLARCPYLSRGDAHAPLYVLDAAVWVCTLR